MKILFENPPYQIREKCQKKFDLTGTIPAYVFGDTIYNPQKADLDPLLLAHETVHIHQQGDNPEQWWDDYLAYDKFRFRQELQAYRVQYKVAKEVVKDRNDMARLLHAIAGDLSGAMYGSMCSRSEAKKLIKE